MKTLRFFTLIIITVGLFLGSCGKDDEPTTTPPNNSGNTNDNPGDNNSAPVIDKTEKTGSVDEDDDGTTTIFTVSASDADEEDTLTYTITTNTEDELFVVSDTGVVTLAAEKTLDFETTNEYTITVTVSDNKGGTDTIDITIAVIDVKIAPVIGETAFTVLEDTKEIGNIKATGEQGNTLEYEITLDEDELFTIDQEGLIALAEGKGLDFETTTKHSITVTVTDGDQITEEEIQITVENVIESPIEDPQSFIFTIEVNGNTPIQIDVFGENVNIEIDWGDGSEVEQADAESQIAHFFDTGEYKIAISGELDRLSFFTTAATQEALQMVTQWGDIEWKSMEDMFRGTDIVGFEQGAGTPNLTLCTSFEAMFRDCNNFNGFVSNWETETITNMKQMFYGAEAFSGSLSTWTVTNVIDMQSMFREAISFNSNISSWVTSSVQDMSLMFRDAETFNQPIGNWNVGAVTTMFSMFQNASAFNQNLGDWDIGNIVSGVEGQNSIAMINMLTGSGMSKPNYALTLFGWADDEDGGQNIPQYVSFDAGDIQYCPFAATSRNFILIGANNWEIDDGLSANINDPDCQ